MADSSTSSFPNRKTQTAALVTEQGGPVKIVHDYPILTPGPNEVLAKVLYTGVCQSDLHTARGTATGADGKPITRMKLPHVGGHEGVARIVALGPSVKSIDGDIRVGGLVSIRFGARVCHRCEFCLRGIEQYCPRATNHLHHEDGSFQEFCVLDAGYLTLLPEGVDVLAAGPTLCAGVTAYKAVLNTEVKAGQWLIVVGAAGGLGHFAVQFARVSGARVIALDSGPSKKPFLESLGVEAYIDISAPSTSPVPQVHALTGTGAHAVVVTAGSARAYAAAAGMLRIGGTLSCVGIPPGEAFIQTPVSTIVIKSLRVVGNLVGSLQECLEAVEFVRRGVVKPNISVRRFGELEKVYEELGKGEVEGRVVLKVAEDE